MKHVLALALALSVVLPVAADYVFYEGNGGQQDVVCTLSHSAQSVNFQNDPYGCTNDEARSVVLSSLPAGAMLIVYDDPGCGTGDDYTRIRVLESFSGLITISSFEGGSFDSRIDYTHFHDNGLDGKVSCVEITLCGDNVCHSSWGETCSLCEDDCGPCGGGGGGGGGGGLEEELLPSGGSNF